MQISDFKHAMCLIFQSAIRNLKSAIDFTPKLRNEIKMKTTRLMSLRFGL